MPFPEYALHSDLNLSIILLPIYHRFAHNLQSNQFVRYNNKAMAAATQTKLLGLGENQLKTNLNEDIYDAKFIKNAYIKWFYTKLVEISATIFAYALVYFASTRQLEHLDPLNYFKKTESKTLLAIVVALTAYCYAQDYFLKREPSDEALKKDEVAKAEAIIKMFWNLSGDIARIFNYFLIYYLFNKDLFSHSPHNSHLIIMNYALIVLWVLFTLRKVLFWLDILVLQKMNSSPWNEKLNAEDHIKEISKGAQEKYNKLVDLLEYYKEQTQQNEKKNK